MSLRTQLRGTGVAIVTPFTTSFEVDYPALEKILNHLINNKVDYIVTLGTTGEASTISPDEKEKIINFTFEKVNNRVPIVVGVGSNNTKEVVEDLKKYPLQNTAAVLSVSPYYSKPSQEGLYQHYKAIADASPKPVILYNVPPRTGRNLDADTTLRLMEHENIGGIKDAAGDIIQSLTILKHRKEDFLVCSGDDALGLSQIGVGMDGVISVIANCMPAKFAQMVRLALEGNFGEAARLNYEMVEVYKVLFAENNPAGVKSAMFHLGLLQNACRLPVVSLSDALHAKMQQYVNQNIIG